MKQKKSIQKKFSTRLIAILFVMLISGPSVYASFNGEVVKQSVNAEHGKQNASGLITNAGQALSYTIKAAKNSTDKRISMDNNDAAPFWQALKKLNSQLDKTERGLLLKDETFFTGMAASVAAAEELKIAYLTTNVNDKKIGEGITKTSSALEVLYSNYSKEGQDKDSNKPLTTAERKQLETLKSNQKVLQQKLTNMEKKLGKNAKGVQELRKKSQELERARYNRHDYFWAMHTFHMMHGWMWGWHWHWGPWGGWCPGYSVIIVDSYYDYYALADAYDWGYIDALVDVEYDLAVELDLLEMDELGSYIDTYEFTEQDYFENYTMPEYFEENMPMEMPENHFEEIEFNMPEPVVQPQEMNHYEQIEFPEIEIGGFEEIEW